MTAALFVRPVGDECLRRKDIAAGDSRRLCARQLLAYDDAVLGRPAISPAVFHGPVSADVPGLVQPGAPFVQQLVFVLVFGTAHTSARRDRRRVAGDELAYLEAEILELGAHSVLHGLTPLLYDRLVEVRFLCAVPISFRAARSRRFSARPTATALAQARRSSRWAGCSQVKPTPPWIWIVASAAATAASKAAAAARSSRCPEPSASSSMPAEAAAST